MPAVSTIPFESHPFTIANADLPRDANAVETVDEKTGEVVGPAPSKKGKELVFLIRAHKGFTKRLDDVAKMGGDMTIFFDGPYSDPPRLSYYDTVVFLAGTSLSS